MLTSCSPPPAQCIVGLVLPRAPAPASPDGTAAAAASNADAVSLVLAHLFSFLPLVRVAPETVAVLARQISLALVGAIILSSIRRVLQGVARVRAPFAFAGRALTWFLVYSRFGFCG